MTDIDPKNYVEALRILVDASSEPGGPSLDDAFVLIAHLNIPQDWLVCLHNGWADYARRYKKPKCPELIKTTKARFLAPRMLRVWKRCQADRRCTLCGLEVNKPAYTWHKQCWKALEPHTSVGWAEVCREKLIESEYKCADCKCNLTTVKRKANGAKYQFDHIIALCLGGDNSINNIQVLCVKCHKKKTKEDMAKLVVLRRKLKNEKASLLGETIS